MESTLGSPSIIGMAVANSVDVFQAGREAAQMAKRQLSDQEQLSIVLALGPDNVHFQDFIEGVRLVTGEEKLIGIPSSPHSASTVIIVSSTSNQFELSSSNIQNNPSVMTTSILSQFRQARGNNRHQFEYHGILSLGPTNIATDLSDDLDLDSWIISVTPSSSQPCPLICRDTVITNGLLAIECLTSQGIGLGVVNLAPFNLDPRAQNEALQLALREAVHQLSSAEPALGLLFINETTSEKILDKKAIGSPFPLLWVSTKSQWCRPRRQTMINADDAVIALVIPQ